jgi:hypothetical protein
MQVGAFGKEGRKKQPRQVSKYLQKSIEIPADLQIGTIYLIYCHLWSRIISPFFDSWINDGHDF